MDLVEEEAVAAVLPLEVVADLPSSVEEEVVGLVVVAVLPSMAAVDLVEVDLE